MTSPQQERCLGFVLYEGELTRSEGVTDAERTRAFYFLKLFQAVPLRVWSLEEQY